MNYYDLLLANKLNGSGGGGGSSPIALLNTINITESVRAVNVDITPYSTYDFLVIFENLTLSASDWLCYVKNGTTESGGNYSGQAITHIGIAGMRLILPGSNREIYAASGTNTLSIYNNPSDPMTNLYIYVYSASHSIVSGKIDIYGGKYADM